jgi:hypothetical protein
MPLVKSLGISLAVVLALAITMGLSSPEWPAYRYDMAREANQPNASALSDPSLVRFLAVGC